MSINDNLKPVYIDLETKEIFLVNPSSDYSSNKNQTNVPV